MLAFAPIELIPVISILAYSDDWPKNLYLVFKLDPLLFSFGSLEFPFISAGETSGYSDIFTN